MSSKYQVWATAIIWGAMALMIKTLFETEINPFSMIVALALLGGAIAGTNAVWGNREESSSKQRRTERDKAKRGDTLADRLIESMNEDELAALKARLMETDNLRLISDGEVVPLDDLLNEQAEARRSRSRR